MSEQVTQSASERIAAICAEIREFADTFYHAECGKDDFPRDPDYQEGECANCALHAIADKYEKGNDE